MAWQAEAVTADPMEFTGGQAAALRVIANPDKLRFAARQAAALSR